MHIIFLLNLNGASHDKMLDLTKYFSLIPCDLPTHVYEDSLYMHGSDLYIYNTFHTTVTSLNIISNISATKFYESGKGCISDGGILYKFGSYQTTKEEHIKIMRYDLSKSSKLFTVMTKWEFNSRQIYSRHIVVKNKLYKLSGRKMIIISFNDFTIKEKICPIVEQTDYGSPFYCYDGKDIIYHVLINTIYQRVSLFMINIRTEIVNIVSVGRQKEIKNFGKQSHVYYHERKIYIYNEKVKDTVVTYDIHKDVWESTHVNGVISICSNIVSDGYFTYGVGIIRGESFLAKYVVPETKIMTYVPMQYSDMTIITEE